MRVILFALLILTLPGCSLTRKAVVWWRYRGEYPLPKTQPSFRPSVVAIPATMKAAETDTACMPKVAVYASALPCIQYGSARPTLHLHARTTRKVSASQPSDSAKALARAKRKPISGRAVAGFAVSLTALFALFGAAVYDLSVSLLRTPSASESVMLGTLYGLSSLIFILGVSLSLSYLVRRVRKQTDRRGAGWVAAAWYITLYPLFLFGLFALVATLL